MSKMLRSPPRPLSEAISFPDVFRTPEPDSESFINMKKRKYRDDLASSNNNVVEDMLGNLQQLFVDLKTNQDVQFTKIESNMNTLKKQNEVLLSSNEDIKKTISEIVKEQNEMKLRIEALEEREKNVEDVKQQCEILERKVRESAVEIRNVPLENNNQIMETVKKIHQLLNLEFYNRDVRNSFRLSAKKDQVRPIVIEFSTVQKKVDLLKALKNYNLENNDKLSSHNIGLPGEKKTVFINEYLTKNAKQLHYQARQEVKKGTCKFCWTDRGRVFVRKEEGSPVIEIKNSEQIRTFEEVFATKND